MRRFLYLLYYLKVTNYGKLRRFLRYAAIHSGRSRIAIIWDAIKSVFIYNISLLDYFYFRFFEIEEEREHWAGTGYMYEYQMGMNPKKEREVLEDKIVFLDHFRSLVQRQTYSYKDLKERVQYVDELLDHSSKRIVLKNSRGQVGAEVEVVESKDFSSFSLLDYMEKRAYDLAEEFVEQHTSIMELSSSGLNTVRIFTQWHNDDFFYLGARLRISVDSHVDNMGAGNLAAPVDIETGIVNGSAVYSDISKEDVDLHPITGKPITGFRLPFWSEVLEMSKRAAELSPENRSVGWDIAITEDGPELIEGNHNWCKLLWQLPVKQGLKTELDRFL